MRTARARWLLLAAVLAAAPAQGQTLNDLLDEARSQRARAAEEDRRRLEAIRGDRDEQARLEAELTDRVAAARARSEALNAAFEANESALAEAQESLDVQLGDLKELFGVVRTQAADVRGVIDSSIVSAQYPGRVALLDRLNAAERLPSIDDLDELRLLIQQEMTDQANIVRFGATIFDAGGVPYAADVVRIGAFNLISGDRYLTYDAQTDSVKELGRQPRARYRKDAAALFDAPPGTTVRMSLDPSYGSLLQALVRQPGLAERVAQGGAVGYIILALGAFGLLLALWRGAALLRSGRAIEAQLRDSTPRENNALGRILQVYSQNRDADTDTLELKLDEAILRETPALEAWHGAIKIIAAVAPLLGLLGTVIGMIETFQSITYFGTGDPRLMADGISKALVTTMQGLIVAIPMVLLHAVVAALAKGQIEILEEQSAGIVARQSEVA